MHANRIEEIAGKETRLRNPAHAVVDFRAQRGPVVQRLRCRNTEYRQVIVGRYQEQLSFEEIGRRLHRSAEAARKLWWRAIERLRQELDSSS